MILLNSISGICYFTNLLFLLSVMLLHVTSAGNLDTHITAVRFSFEDVVPKTTWISAGRLQVLCQRTVDDVVGKAQMHFGHIVYRTKIMSPSVVRRLIIMVADALEGKVIYARLLPRITGLYCDSHATFTALSFVHDVEKDIR